MMRFDFALALATLIALPAAARADDSATLAPEIAQCINDNASKVEAAVSDLNQAVDFLVSDVCAEPIAAQGAQQAKRSSERMAAQWKKLCDEEPADKKKSGSDFCAMTKLGFASESGDEDGLSYAIAANTWGKPAAAVALASRKLLDLRLSHTPAKGTK
jgi:hypothetical protein